MKPFEADLLHHIRLESQVPWRHYKRIIRGLDFLIQVDTKIITLLILNNN